MTERNFPRMPASASSQLVQLVPDTASVARTVDATISAATDVTLDTKTKIIEVNALTQGIYMRYAATASAANFDEFILANTVRHYVIPVDVTVVSFIEETAGAKLILIEK